MIFTAQKYQYRKINILVSVLALVVSLFAAYELNLLGIRLWVESSSLGERIATGISTNDSFIEKIVKL